MKFKCLIVDDEPLAIKLIENHIAKIDALEVVATANNALKAFEILNTTQIDLLFLDIKMPSITGIDFLHCLKNPPKTIFTTAYRDFALESYELEAVDYLLKPITFERFFKSVDRFLRENKVSHQSSISSNSSSSILLKSNGKNFKVNLEEVLYIESVKDYIQVYLENGNSITSKYKISDFEHEVSSSQFVRIHRSFLINKDKITAFSNNDIEINGIEIPFGASYKEQTNQLLLDLKSI